MLRINENSGGKGPQFDGHIGGTGNEKIDFLGVIDAEDGADVAEEQTPTNAGFVVPTRDRVVERSRQNLLLVKLDIGYGVSSNDLQATAGRAIPHPGRRQTISRL